MIRTKQQMKTQWCDACHDGVGALFLRVAIDMGDSDQSLLFVHDDVLPAGVTIGGHAHHGSEEVYYVLEGTGVLTLDHVESPVGPGDVSLCKSGHSHGIANTGTTDMRLIVVGMRTQ